MEFPQWVVDRVMARQGRLHPHDAFKASETAFVVVDLQNFFTQPGFMGECKFAPATFPAVNRLASALRQAGGHVIWVQTCSDNADEFWSHFHNEMMLPDRSQRRLDEMSVGHPGYELAPGLDARPEDTRVIKRYYSALSPGSSNLQDVLQEKGIKTVLIGGTTTNVCCESTARNAMMMDYRTIMVHDALSAFSPQEHEFALCQWMLYFGDVLGADEVVSRLT